MWLDEMKILVREYRIPENPRLTADGFSPETNTIYLFHGDYWHGNPAIYDHNTINAHNKKSFGALFERTIAIEKELISYGYGLHRIWESEWVKARSGF